jgi:hypothetical protein
MVHGWSPSKLVSGDPDFQPRWPQISIFSNGSHLGWSPGLSDTLLKGTHPGTIPARFGLIWLSGFRGEDLNVILFQNMPILHNRYKSAERKISDFDRLCKLGIDKQKII